MRMQFHCPVCSTAAMDGEGKWPKEHARLSPVDSGLYEFTCFQGHTAQVILQNLRFETLFEIGAYAISDGYYREAISSFASSLERFLELYISVVCRRQGISVEMVDKAWKDVRNQSERQLGAYFFLYVSTERSHAPYLSQAMVTLRNNVIHKGKFASQNDAIQFGNAVLAIVNPIIQLLKERDRGILDMLIFEHLKKAGEKTRGKFHSTMCIPTIFSLAHLASGPRVTDLETWQPPKFR